MLVINEHVASRVVTIGDAIEEVERAFVALHRGEAEVFPVVMGRGPTSGTSFGVKSGQLSGQNLVGAKIGSYWPPNRSAGIPAHASTTILLDAETGYPRALIAASHLTALRTAASDGVGIRCLSRPDSTRLGVVGAGHQAWFEIAAACEVRPIEDVAIYSRTREDAERLARRVADQLGVRATARSLEDTVREADILVTVTAAREALIHREWVRPGTHISTMGSDARGKHELDPILVGSARLFADVVEQSITLGDFEAALERGLIERADITPIGAVVERAASGRTSPDGITIYDSSGMALQDLVIGELALRRASEAGLIEAVELGEPRRAHMGV